MERRDIRMRPAEYPILTFIDGYDALITSMVKDESQENMPIWRLKIIPTDPLAKRWKISLDELDEDRMIERCYNVKDLIQLNPDPAMPRWLCLKNYQGQDGSATPFLAGSAYLKEVESLQRDILRLKAKIAAVTYRLKIAETNNFQWVKENVELIRDLIPETVAKKE